MRKQNSEIDEANRTLSGKAHAANGIMVGEIGNEERDGDQKSCAHAGAVRRDVLPTNVIETQAEEQRAGSVQSGIKSGKGRHSLVFGYELLVVQTETTN